MYCRIFLGLLLKKYEGKSVWITTNDGNNKDTKSYGGNDKLFRKDAQKRRIICFPSFFIEISHGIVSQSIEKNNFVRNYCEKIQNQNTT